MTSAAVMEQFAGQAERGAQISNMLRILAHTSQIDPDFFKLCVAEAARDVTPGFGVRLEQYEGEFSQMLEHARGCGSALEIGSRYGESIKRIAEVLKPGSRVVSVDLPYADAGGTEPAEPILRANMAEIHEAGYETHLFLGDSHSQEVVEKVRALGPFDFCFIDGDHSYEGVKADWENYGPMAKVVAFHDIVNNVGCFTLWNEVKAASKEAGWRTVEYTSSLWLGIGVVFKDK